jgi:hypothetical protein
MEEWWTAYAANGQGYSSDAVNERGLRNVIDGEAELFWALSSTFVASLVQRCMHHLWVRLTGFG